LRKVAFNRDVRAVRVLLPDRVMSAAGQSYFTCERILNAEDKIVHVRLADYRDQPRPYRLAHVPLCLPHIGLVTDRGRDLPGRCTCAGLR